MMRRWGLALLLIAAPAAAQPAADAPDDAPAAQQLGYAALPGGLHAPSATTLPAGTVAVEGQAGYGFRKGLLGNSDHGNHRFARTLGDLAIAYAPLPFLTLALSLDGRYDKHYGLTKQDDGYVGDPHLLVRVSKPFGNVKLGAQLDLWVPGKDAPSIAGSAISVDLRALATLQAGPGELSFDAGFRLDNSAKSIESPELLSVQDQVSLGVSKFNAFVAGAHLALPFGKVFVGLEASLDYFFGTQDFADGTQRSSPGAIIRVAGEVGYHLSDQWALLVYVEGAKVPGMLANDVMNDDITLLPYEPTITGGLALSGRFGGARKHGTITRNEHPVEVAVIEYAEVSGSVVDTAGKPVVGAKVTIKLKNNTGTGATDDKGEFLVSKLPIGKTLEGTTALDDTAASVEVSVDGLKPGSATLTLAKGANAVPKLTLEPVLPPGQLRGVVRSLSSGKPILNATIKVEPIGKTVTTGADGTFTIDLPPGEYTVKVKAPGLAEQSLPVKIEENGVAIKNIDLHQ